MLGGKVVAEDVSVLLPGAVSAAMAPRPAAAALCAADVEEDLYWPIIDPRSTLPPQRPHSGALREEIYFIDPGSRH